jgi:predicted MFS family arabinose efflux permease
MTILTAPPLQAAPEDRPGRRLPARAAFWLQVSIAVTFLAGSSAPTPLYTVYQAQWGFSPITTTVVFGVYALAVLASLLVFGSLSDHIGRRPVLLVAILVQVAAMAVFATAAGVPELMAARIVQGLSTGAAVGALGAGLLDLDRVRGTIANAVAPVLGTASGALVSAFFVQFLPGPTRLIYVALLVAFALQAVGVLFMRESAAARPGALASLRVHLALPPAARRPLLVATPALVALWSLAGFYGSLGPALVRLVSGSDSVVLGGLALFVLAGSGGLAVLFVQGTPPRDAMLLGIVGLLTGVTLTLLAVRFGSTLELFVGAVVAGVGFGAAFQGALRTIIPAAAPHERAGVLSLVYVVCYLSMGLPAVAAGYLVVHGGGVLTATRDYGVAVGVLAGLALLGLVRRPRPVALPCPRAAEA